MNTPFSSAQFFEVFQKYNTSVFPGQIILFVFAFSAVILIAKKASIASLTVSLMLTVFWIWMGAVYHIIFFAKINPAANVFGSLFIMQGLLLFYNGVIKKNLVFGVNKDKYGITGSVLILYALIVYPLLGYLSGHVYPSSPTFGLPCPTTIFTFGIFLFSVKKIPFTVLIIPALWAIIGFTAVLNFGVIEDTGLLISGVIALTMIIVKNKRSEDQV